MPSSYSMFRACLSVYVEGHILLRINYTSSYSSLKYDYYLNFFLNDILFFVCVVYYLMVSSGNLLTYICRLKLNLILNFV